MGGTDGLYLPTRPLAGTSNEYGYRTFAGCGTTGNRGALQNVTVPVSGQMWLSYFRAPKSFTANTVIFAMNVNGAASPTVAQFGLYAVNSADGSLTSMLGSTANDTALFTSGASVSVPKTKALQAGVPLTVDTWYCLGLLIVSGVSMPALAFTPSGAASTTNIEMASFPRLNGNLNGQASLPASVTGGLISAANIGVWSELSS